MRFALLGNHPDGVATACALVDSGRHRLAAYTAPVGEEVVRRWGPDARRVADVEEILADPAVEAVLVAGSPAARPEQLRRALQSERRVLCVFPPDATPEVAYEAAINPRNLRARKGERVTACLVARGGGLHARPPSTPGPPGRGHGPEAFGCSTPPLPGEKPVAWEACGG
jgi:hypothetical protein